MPLSVPGTERPTGGSSVLTPEPDRDPYGDPWQDDVPEEGAGKMSFLEHLDELRKRILHSVIALVAGCIVGFAFVDKIQRFIMDPLYRLLPEGQKFVFTEPTEGFMLTLKIGVLAGLFLASPIIMWELWLFVAPGLYSHEKRFAIPFVFLTTVFFVAGAAFSHYVVFPLAWQFFGSFQTDYLQYMPSIGRTFSLYVKMLLALGVVFELPTVVFFLARMGVVTARFMIRHTKHAVLIIFIIAAVITPSADVVTQALVAGPMCVLYVLSIGIAWAVGRKRGSVE